MQPGHSATKRHTGQRTYRLGSMLSWGSWRSRLGAEVYSSWLT
jgi:hypothetical protein